MSDTAGTSSSPGAAATPGVPGTPGTSGGTESAGGLAGDVGRGIAWSTVSNLVLRLGSLATGIVLARLLSPEQFGVYAVALTVQAILMTLADLGLSADLIRTPDPERKKATVGTLGLVTGGIMTVVMATTAHQFAGIMGSPQAGDVILLLSFTLLLGGAGVVPLAMMQRRFEQKKLLVISIVDFIIGTAITFAFLLTGWGVISLAIGRVAAQCVSLVLQFILAKERPRYGFDRELVGPILRFGLPIAGANMLSWSLLNIDNVVISRVAGPVSLGFYVLAFNVSSWPMTAIGQVIRSVSLPAFARSEDRSRALTTATALTWAVAFPAGAFLAVLSGPLIEFVYGAKWAAAAPVLAALGIFGALRAVFDVFASYLLSRGSSGAVLWIQLIWFVALVPSIILATIWFGIVGAGWVHLVVGVVIVLPCYAVAIHRGGGRLGDLARVSWQPVAAMLLAGPTALLVAALIPVSGLALLAGGLAGGGVYALLMFRWVLRRIRAAKAISEHASASSPTQVTDDQGAPAIPGPTDGMDR